MPNQIKDKGKALCLIGAYFCVKLEKKGVSAHYLGVIEDGKLKRLTELEAPTNSMEVKLLRVLYPELRDNRYDYSVYKKERANFLIPLEVIYRNSLPAGSSVFKRLKEGSLKLEDIGLEEMPSPGQKLERPILDVSTKLESTDRYLTWEEAKELAALTDQEIEEIKRVTLLVNEIISEEVSRAGLVHEDGKIEFGFDENRNLLLVDVLGTPDECRFTFNGLPVSKEIARIFYRKTDWYKMVDEAKKEDELRWKNLVKEEPPPLPSRLSELISLLYQACCDEITQRKWFEAQPLKEVLLEINTYLQE
jgi:phosphoribosylaminoimidazole-succinocarboxamide synthase